jgi:crotonyl-CoA carboxylase/reductase
VGELPQAHLKMLRNEHKPGNMAVLVSGATHRAAAGQILLEGFAPSFGPGSAIRHMGRDG